MGISTLTVLCSTFDNQYLTGSAEQFFRYQLADGSIPIAVPAQARGLSVTGSFGPPPSLSTQDYTMMQVTDAYQYWMCSGDTGWLTKNWASIRGIMTWLAGQVGTNGLMSGAARWPRRCPPMPTTTAASSRPSRWPRQSATPPRPSAYASLAPAFGKNDQFPAIQPGRGHVQRLNHPADRIRRNRQRVRPAVRLARAGPVDQCGDARGQPDQGAGRAEGPVRVLLGSARRQHRAVRGRLGGPRPARRRAGQGALDLIRQVWGLMLPQNTPYYSGGCWEYVAQTGLPGLARAPAWPTAGPPARRPHCPCTCSAAARSPPDTRPSWSNRSRATSAGPAGGCPPRKAPIAIDWTTNAHAAGFTLTVDVPPGTQAYAGVPPPPPGARSTGSPPHP